MLNLGIVFANNLLHHSICLALLLLATAATVKERTLEI